MRTKLEKNRLLEDIFRIEEEFATLIDVDKKTKKFIYQFEYWVNTDRSIHHNANIVEIVVYKTNPGVKFPIFKKNVLTPLAVRNSILDHLAITITKQKKISNSAVLREKSDITSVLNNNTFSKKEHLDNFKTEIISLERDELRGASVVGDARISTIRKESKTISLKGAALRSILIDGRDPSDVGRSSFPVIPTEKVLSGLAFVTDRISPAIERLNSIRNDRMIQTPINRTSRTTAKSVQDIKQELSFVQDQDVVFSRRPKRDSPMVIDRRRNFWKKVSKKIEIDFDKISGVHVFFVSFNLKSNASETLETKVKSVTHEENLDRFFTPEHPPIIDANSVYIGKNVVHLRQVDPVGTSVKLYRRILDPNKPSISNDKYVLLDEITAEYGAGVVGFSDETSNNNVCMYRALAVGERGTVSTGFSTAIVKPILISGNRKNHRKHASVFAETIENQEVKVRVSNIAIGPVSAYVTATDMTVSCLLRERGERKSRIVGKVVSDQLKTISKSTTDLVFYDDEVKPNHVYEYRCVLIYPYGKEVKTAPMTHEYRQEFEQHKTTSNVSNVEVSVSANGISVTFDLFARFTDVGVEEIINQLGDLGLDSNFLDDIEKDRSRFSDLIAFIVERQDSISGETETFGRWSPGKFLDNKVSRASKGVSELVPGRTYRYISRLCLRSIETFFFTSARESVDLRSLSRFKALAIKFFNPTALKLGILPSTARASDNSSVSSIVLNDPFNEGRTGVEIAVEVSIPKARTKISSISCRRVNKINSLSWSVSGNREEIDHFLVMANYQGVKSILASVHSMSDSHNFNFNDLELSSYVGEIDYSIIPVYKNFEYGSETTSVRARFSGNTPTDIRKDERKRG